MRCFAVVAGKQKDASRQGAKAQRKSRALSAESRSAILHFAFYVLHFSFFPAFFLRLFPFAPLRLCVSLFVALSALSVAGAADSNQRWDGAHPAVVRIIVPERNAMAYGSGTLVGGDDEHGLIVTNWHVVRDAAGPISVVFADGFRSGAIVLKTDHDWDLAALAIWRPPAVQPVPVATYLPPQGEPLTIAGYGPGWYRAAGGRCLQYVAPLGNFPAEIIEVSVAAREGDSGGPIFNSRGEIAGVLFGTAEGKTAGSYGGRVRSFLVTTLDDFRRMHTDPRPGQMIAQAGAPGQAYRAEQPAAPARPTPPPTPPVQPAPTVRLLATSPPPRPTAPSAPPMVAATPSPSLVSPAAAPRDAVAASSAAIGPRPIAGDESSGMGARPPEAAPLAATQAPAATNAAITLADLAGATRGEQIKTLLAAIGLLAVALRGFRLLAAGSAKEPTAQAKPARQKRKLKVEV